MLEIYHNILQDLKHKSVVSLGGTEAVSVAYSVALAKEKSQGALKKIYITVDSSIFKNGLNVIIPGTNERGLDIAAALGYVCGKADEKLQAIADFSQQDLTNAKKLLTSAMVSIKIKDDCDKLYIETIVESEGNTVCVLVQNFHLNVIHVEEAQSMAALKGFPHTQHVNYIANEHLNLENFLDFAEHVPFEELWFIAEGLRYNLAIANSEEPGSFVTSFENVLAKFQIKNDMITDAQNLCMRACEARIRGVKLPVMTTIGSANYGIVTYLSNYAIAHHLQKSDDALLRAIALSNLMSMYVSAYTGSISSVCGCSLAAGIGASVGIVYLLEGDLNDMYGAVKNFIGSITGVLCDGTKPSCAWKLGLSVDWAIKSALLAVEGAVVANDGILSDDLDQVFANLRHIYSSQANMTNQSIVEILQGIRYE